MGGKHSMSKPRLSLLSLFLLTAIVALSVTVAVLWSEVGPLRREVRQLRGEVGKLYVQDESLPCALALETDSDYEWKWIVWVPEGEQYEVFLATEVPKVGLPAESEDSITLRGDGSNFIVRYRLRRDPVDNWLKGSLTGQDRRADQAGSEFAWIEWTRRIIETRGVGRTAEAAEPDQPFVLLRYRVSETAAGIPQIEDPSPGVMLWMEKN